MKINFDGVYLISCKAYSMTVVDKKYEGFTIQLLVDGDTLKVSSKESLGTLLDKSKNAPVPLNAVLDMKFFKGLPKFSLLSYKAL